MDGYKSNSANATCVLSFYYCCYIKVFLMKSLIKFLIKWYKNLISLNKQRKVRKRIRKNNISWEKKIRGVN
jgi:hypothetical protein